MMARGGETPATIVDAEATMTTGVIGTTRRIAKAGSKKAVQQPALFCKPEWLHDGPCQEGGEKSRCQFPSLSIWIIARVNASTERRSQQSGMPFVCLPACRLVRQFVLRLGVFGCMF